MSDTLDDLVGGGGLLETTRTSAEGPAGQLPLTPEMLLDEPSGNLFGMTQDAGMGWSPSEVWRDQFLIMSTHGGLRDTDGQPVALGYHTGHWEIGLLVRAAAETFRAEGVVPFAAYCSDPCDGRTQGTTGMFDSLPYRNDAAITMRRLIRSLPRRSGVMGIATCDKGLPATMIALAGVSDLPGIVVPGGVTLPARGAEDAGKVQIHRRPLRARAHQPRRRVGRRLPRVRHPGRRMPVPRHRSDVTGRRRGIRDDVAAQRARAVGRAGLVEHGTAIRTRAGTHGGEHSTLAKILTPAALDNAMLLHAAFGGSTNLLLHIPAIAHAAGLRRARPSTTGRG